jgi:hypothetical protein
MRSAGIPSRTCMELTLRIDLALSRFQQILVVNDHHVLVARVIHDELLCTDRPGEVLEKHVVRLTMRFMAVTLDADCGRVIGRTGALPYGYDPPWHEGSP